MSSPQGMHLLDARVASFDAVKPKGKKRTSSTKAKKNTFTWDFSSPFIDQLAQAGFYYSPTAHSEDNVSCFHCHNSLDEWEEGDDPFREHLAAVPECAWAIVTAIEKGVTQANDEHDPLSEEFLQARIATFGSSWPFEKKKGWTPQTKKLAEAGWHYVPSAESDDYVKCAYCNLGLDGWEPKDKPIEEHKRRSPECNFIVLSELHKKSRKKKPRASKASRTSSQSIANSVLDERNTFDESAQLDDSIMTTATDVTAVSNVSTVSKKGGKAKKATAKTGGKTARNKKVEEPEGSQQPVIEDSVIEVEPPVPQKKTRGKKRTTTDMQTEAEQEEAAPPKKRASRARASTAQSVTAPEPSFVADASTMDAPEEISMPKRGAKGRGKASTGSRAASRTTSGTRQASARKASAASTASTAPLRQTGLDEGEIDAMLEADLDRPGSDEEMPDAEPVESEPKPKAKRQTRAKVVKKPASKAALRKASQATLDDEMPDLREVSHHVLPEEPSHVMEDSVVVTRFDALFKNPYEDINSQGAVDDADTADELETAPAPVKAKAKGKKAVGKAITTAKKGKKSQPAKEVTPAPEVEESDFDEIVEERPAEPERTELRFSSSFEHEPSVLEEAEVPADLVEHFSPKKAAPPAKALKPAKAVKNAKVAKNTKKAPGKVASVPVKAKTPVPAEEEEIVESEPEVARDPSPSPVRPLQRAPQQQFQSPARSAPRGFPSPTPSPQSSNAENEPPSSRPSQKRPPLAPLTPSQGKTNTMRIPTTAETTTPTRSIRKDRADGSMSPQWALKSSFNWHPIDLETIFLGSPNSKQMKWFEPANQNKENQLNPKKGAKAQQILLTSPEKRMTVEEWIRYNAGKGEEKLRVECERTVGRFESQGVIALKALEGLEVQE